MTKYIKSVLWGVAVRLSYIYIEAMVHKGSTIKYVSAGNNGVYEQNISLVAFKVLIYICVHKSPVRQLRSDADRLGNIGWQTDVTAVCYYNCTRCMASAYSKQQPQCVSRLYAANSNLTRQLCLDDGANTCEQRLII